MSEREQTVYKHEGGVYSERKLQTAPPSLGLHENPFRASVELSLSIWYQFQPIDAVEALLQKTEIMRFQTLEREMLEYEARGLSYKLVCDDKGTYKLQRGE